MEKAKRMVFDYLINSALGVGGRQAGGWSLPAFEQQQL